jgi:hypothetical protein
MGATKSAGTRAPQGHEEEDRRHYGDHQTDQRFGADGTSRGSAADSDAAVRELVGVPETSEKIR